MRQKSLEDRVLQTILATESLLGVSITIHDRSGIFRGKNGEYLLNRTRGIHRHPCCRLIHDHRCLQECRDRIDPEAELRHQPFAHECWKGLKEVVVPVKRDGVLLFVLFAGGFRADKKAKSVPDPRLKGAWQQYHGKLPVLTAVHQKELALALDALGNGIVQLIEEINLPSGKDEGRLGIIKRFLHYNAHRKIAMSDLAGVLALSRFRTSHLVSELFGMPFRSLLLKERLKRARTLLLANPDRPVAAVADMVGLADEYHFNREFKKEYGLPPGKYRKAHAD